MLDFRENNNIQRILLFLFVNGKCYGSQLQRALQIPLTPLQKALSRLEKENVLLSHYEGKTRLYQFNPAYPVQAELEALLKKSYTLLSPQEKKRYTCLECSELSIGLTQKERSDILALFWKRLASIKTLTFHAKTKSQEKTGWSGKGRGDVVVSKESPSTLIFKESGSWKNEEGQEMDFTNTFRWNLDRARTMISLEHLRFGIDRPVFLFHLAPSDFHILTSVDAHYCNEDTYFGQIFSDENTLRLRWRMIGPKKNEEINYYYT